MKKLPTVPNVDDWILGFGGLAAKKRWNRESDKDRESTGEFIAAAKALLHGCSAVLACCGDKTDLDVDQDNPLVKKAYYEEYYDFASQRAGLSVVRLFPHPGSGPENSKKVETLTLDIDTHNNSGGRKRDGVMAAWTTHPTLDNGAHWPNELGFVLFKHSVLTSALVHWKSDDDGNRFTWRLFSDPLLTMVFCDYWGMLAAHALVSPNQDERTLADPEGKLLSSVHALALRFGINWIDRRD